MRYALSLLMLGVCGSAHADITSNLIYHWKFDNDLTEEVASNTFTETSGTATYTTSGLPFSGSGTTHSLVVTSDDLLTSSSAATGITAAWTYAVWFKVGDNNTSFVHHEDAAADVFLRYTTNAFIQVTSGAYTLTSTANVNDGGWHHVVATYDGVDRAGLNLYIDGSLDQTGTGVVAFGVADEEVLIPSAAGKAANLDDLRIYSRELSSADVTELYNFTGAASGPAINPISSSIPGSSLDPIRTTIP